MMIAASRGVDSFPKNCMAKVFFIALGIFVFAGASCKEQKTQKERAERTVFGQYKFSNSLRATITLRRDSIAVVNIKLAGNAQKSKLNSLTDRGTYTIYNDSIFITWKNGKKVSSAFVKTEKEYSFKIGATTYRLMI